MSDGERIASLETLIKAQTTAIESLTRKVEDVVLLRRDMDYHRRDIDRAHEGIRDLDGRVNGLEGKEAFNKWARWALFVSACALCKLAWDSHAIAYQERVMRDKLPPHEVAGK